ncbi:MAG TPA: hypothetical protein VMH39_06175 [Gemmatimonadaceae bacterium]|nr:hypothetical protein [Gemmatimonadaceae bacterium]
MAQMDSAGNAKMKTLDDALLLWQRINGLVEQYAIAVKKNQSASQLVMNIRRQLPSLAANLKAQFALISDQVIAINLAASRGASEAMRVRALREGMAQVKQSIEVAMVATKDKHTVQRDSTAVKSDFPA